MAHKLRIAVSVFFGMTTLTLVVRWTRSHWWHDVLQACCFRCALLVATSLIALTLGFLVWARQ